MPRPRPQRARRHHHRLISPATPPYYRRVDRRRSSANDGTCCRLSDDALADIFSRLPETADLVRCAATCARWARVVATSAAALSRSLPPPPWALGRRGFFLPQLAVGFLCQGHDRPVLAARNTRGSVARFLAMGTAGSSRLLLGSHHRSAIGSLFHHVVGNDPDLDLGGGETTLDYSRLVASRAGRLVVALRRRRDDDDDDGRLTFCVCNPITGDVSVLPPLPDMPVSYACTVLTGDDDLVDPPQQGQGQQGSSTTTTSSTSSFFRLLLVYNRPGFTALRCYASDMLVGNSGGWGAEAKSAVDVSDEELRHVGPAVVLRGGVAFWPLDHGALGVQAVPRLLDLQPNNNQAAMTMAMHAHLLPYDVTDHDWPENRLLGVSTDGRLFFMHFSIRAGLNVLCAKISYFEMQGGDGDLWWTSGRKESSSLEQGVLIHQMRMGAACWPRRDALDSLKLRWFGEKSGIVLFTMAESGGGHCGTFALSLRDGTVQMVADGEGDQWRNLLGFEMDRQGYLASLF